MSLQPGSLFLSFPSEQMEMKGRSLQLRIRVHSLAKSTKPKGQIDMTLSNFSLIGSALELMEKAAERECAEGYVDSIWGIITLN